MFIDAILEHGVSSRVRGDRGGENRDVSIMMILLRGLDRASFMWGFLIQELSVYRWRWGGSLQEHGEHFSDDWSVFTFWTEAIPTICGFCIFFSWMLSTLTALIFKTTGIHIQFLVQATTRVQM
jgi:hypothetical protein